MNSWIRFTPFLAVLELAFVIHPQTAAASDDSAPADRATLVIQLPARGTLTIDGESTQQTGPERTFVSPPLQPGKKYVYTLSAAWQEAGQPRAVERTVRVAAGQRVVVDLTAPPPGEGETGKSRSFLFTYSATVTGLKPGQSARIWLPMPPTNEDQTVSVVKKNLPGPAQTNKEPKFGNEILHVDAKADAKGQIPLAVVYRVTRKEVRATGKVKLDSEQLALYLKPDSKVPVEGKPLELLKDKQLSSDQMEAARQLYAIVNGHMRYSKEGTGWGQGDAVWACESGYGNCTDFHSLFISLARSQHIPSKFEIGFPLPTQRGSGEIPGYHCWAKFHPANGGWVPVDISEANKNPKLKDYYFGNLSEDRLSFSTGRDLDLVPKQAGKPLNFFVYPYVEVDGKPYPAEKVSRKFSYEDVPEAQ